jgi:tRNA G18 (ribose-2'-O)-methylase SpoU
MQEMHSCEAEEYESQTQSEKRIRDWRKELDGKYAQHALLVYHASDMRRTYAILHNIRSAHNVGSVFRSADGAGVSKLFLTGYTPAPIDRFGREHAEIAKTSLGATHTVPYEVVPDIHALIVRLKEEGVHMVAIEQTPEANAYREVSLPESIAFIFGNEVTGIEPDVLAVCDQHLMIPMAGRKESLNVSVCAGIILFHFT